MAGTRPTAAKLYQSPADEDVKGASTYTPPGAPMQILNNSYAPNQAAESASDSVPPVGSRVTHRTSGETGQVVGHVRHGHSGTAVPQVTWQGEEASWPQAVAANALRTEGSHPSELYSRNPAPDSPGSDSPSNYTRSDGPL